MQAIERAEKIVEQIVPLDYPADNRAAAEEFVKSELEERPVYAVMQDGHPIPMGLFFDHQEATDKAAAAGQGLYFIIEYLPGLVGKKELNQLFID